MRNALGSEVAAVVGAIDPDAYTANSYSTGWVDMGKFGRIMAIVLAGDLGAGSPGGTLAAKLEQGQGSGGSNAKDITGKAITTLDEDDAGSNKQAIINCRDDELDLANGYTHVRLTITVATATSDACGLVLGLDPRYGPASDNDAASVVEIVD